MEFRNSIRPSNPIAYHIEQARKIRPALSFDENGDFDHQREKLREKLRELVKIPEKRTEPIPLEAEWDTSDPRFDEIRFLIESEPSFYVPAHMLLPKKYSGKLPMVICLQGHSTGMHVSLGREPYPGKAPIEVAGDRDFCLQAVARGYAAITMEQRGFGELHFSPRGNSCQELYTQAILMNRSLLGERLRDISALIDAVEAGFDFIDTKKIGIMGNSGGGTSSYFAACLEERIKVTMPSSSFCTFLAAWGSIYHCCCGYVPGILNEMEMGDMAAMIAPRPLVIVNGRYDPIQPFEAAEAEYETVKKIYRAAGVPDNCAFVAGEEGHRFYAAQAWPIFDGYMNGGSIT